MVSARGFFRSRAPAGYISAVGVAALLAAACSSVPSASEDAATAKVSGDAGAAPGSEAGGPTQEPGTLEIGRLAYLAFSNGPKTLIEGTSATPNERVTLLVEFLDSAFAPISVNDGAEGSTSFLELLAISNSQGEFFTAIQSIEGFDTNVRAMRVTATGFDGTSTKPVTAPLTQAPVRPAGEACDRHGFDVCAAQNVCAPTEGQTRCVAESTYRASTCANAPLLAPASGVARVKGRTDSPTLWDAPVGCVQSGALGMPYPQGFARLHLDAASTVALTTEDPETDVDTVLFVLDGCGERKTKPLACNDDVVGSSSSTVVLEDLPAGDYVVVVQAATSAEGSFRITASLK